MRGGKITSHAGVGSGIGGKTFQKGLFVGKRVIEEGLDQTQPPMEMTFFGASGNQRVSQEALPNIPSLVTNEDGYSIHNVSPASKPSISPQRLVIATQTSGSSPGNSPTVVDRNNSILGENCGFNVDLQKLTRMNANQMAGTLQSKVENHENGFQTTEKAVVSSKYYLFKAPQSLFFEQQQQNNGQQQPNQSSPYFQAFMQQNGINTSAQRSYSVDSFEGQARSVQRKEGVLVNENGQQYLQRPIQTQSAEKFDELGTPRQNSNEISEEMNSSQQHHISPILHIHEQIEDRSANDKEQHEQVDDTGANYKEDQVASSVPAYNQINKSQANGQAEKKQQIPNRIRNQKKAHVVDIGGIDSSQIPMMAKQMVTKVPMPHLKQKKSPSRKQPVVKKGSQNTDQARNSQERSLTRNTSSQAEFKPLSPHVINIRENSRIAASKYEPKSQVGTLLDCTIASQGPRMLGSRLDDEQNELLLDSSFKKIQEQHQKPLRQAYSRNFGNLPQNFSSENQDGISESHDEWRQTHVLSGIAAGGENQQNETSRLSSQLMVAADPENLNSKIPQQARIAQENENSGFKMPHHKDQPSRTRRTKMKLNKARRSPMSASDSDDERASVNPEGYGYNSSEALGELKHGQPTQPQLNPPMQSGGISEHEQGYEEESKRHISQVKVELHRLIPDSSGNNALFDGTLHMNAEGALYALQQMPQHLGGATQTAAGYLYPQNLLQNEQVISQLNNYRPRDMLCESRASQDSADSLNRALHQIESFDFNKQLEITRQKYNQSPGMNDYYQTSPLANFMATGHGASVQINGSQTKRSGSPTKKGVAQKQRERELLPLATVNMMSGSVTLDATNAYNSRSNSPKRDRSPKNEREAPSPKYMQSKLQVNVKDSTMLKTSNLLSSPINLKPLPSNKDNQNNYMMRTVFVEEGLAKNREAFGGQGMHDANKDVKVNFGDTSFIYKPHRNTLYRTNYAMKEENSSDTVSTEFNYLQPAVKSMKLNNRASIHPSSQGGVIHVLENNVASETTSEPRHNSTELPHSLVTTNEAIYTENFTNPNEVGKLQQIMKDAVDSPTTTIKKASKLKLKQGSPMSRMSRKSPTPKLVSPSPKSKLTSPARRLSANHSRCEESKNEELQNYSNGEHEQTTTVVLVKNALDSRNQNKDKQKTLTRDSTLKDAADSALYQQPMEPHFEEIKKILTDDKNVNITLKRVTRNNSSKERSRIDSKVLNQTLTGDDSSQLLHKGASFKNIHLDTHLGVAPLSPTKIVVGHSSKMSNKEVERKSSQVRRARQKEEQQFQAKKLQVFDMPSLEKKKSVDIAIRSGGNVSPQLFRKDVSKDVCNDASKSSLLRIQNQKSNTLASDPSKNKMQMPSIQNPSRTKKTIDVDDERLKKPNMLTTYKSNVGIEENDKVANDLKRDTQSLDTKQDKSEPELEQHQEEKDSVAEPNIESKMRHGMPTLFNSEFSKTYADLLKNVGAPLEHRSDVTESDYTLYPVLGGQPGRMNVEGGIRIDSKTVSVGSPLMSPLRVSMGLGIKPVEQKPANPELQFYIEVLQRIKNTHKHVVNDDAIKQVKKDYKKYLGDSSQDQKGIFGELERKKIIKPTMPLKNETELDPELAKFKTDRNLDMQYNMAVIKARGNENLPVDWKTVSPLNRFKTKLKFNKLRIGAAKAEQDKQQQKKHHSQRRNTDSSSPQATIYNRHALVPQLTAADKMMFKSLISSQEFSLGGLGIDQAAAALDSQSVLPDRRQTLERERTVQCFLPGSKPNIRAKISQSMDLSTHAERKHGTQVHWNKDKQSRNAIGGTQLEKLSAQIGVMPLNIYQQSSEQDIENDAFASLQNLRRKNHGGRPDLGQSDMNFAKKNPSPDLVAGYNTRYHTKRISPQALVPKGESALINFQSQQSVNALDTDQTLQGSPRLQNRHSVLVADSRATVDPMNNPQNPHAKLGTQRSCFADVLSFRGDRPNLKQRVGQHGTNPFLHEIESRLRNPETRSLTLATSLAIRQSDPAQEWSIGSRRKVGKDKTIKIALKEIYKSVQGQRNIPPVPLHRMDKITRNLTESLLEDTAAERTRQSEWQRQEVMLPILNTVHRNVTLHTSKDLKTTNIHKQKVIQKNAGSIERTSARNARKEMIKSYLEELREEQATVKIPSNRAASKLSMLSIVSTPEVSSRQAMSPSPIPKQTFNNSMLRQATELSQYNNANEEQRPMMVKYHPPSHQVS